MSSVSKKNFFSTLPLTVENYIMDVVIFLRDGHCLNTEKKKLKKNSIQRNK